MVDTRWLPVLHTEVDTRARESGSCHIVVSSRHGVSYLGRYATKAPTPAAASSPGRFGPTSLQACEVHLFESALPLPQRVTVFIWLDILGVLEGQNSASQYLLPLHDS